MQTLAFLKDCKPKHGEASGEPKTSPNGLLVPKVEVPHSFLLRPFERVGDVLQLLRPSKENKCEDSPRHPQSPISLLDRTSLHSPFQTASKLRPNDSPKARNPFREFTTNIKTCGTFTRHSASLFQDSHDKDLSHLKGHEDAAGLFGREALASQPLVFPDLMPSVFDYGVIFTESQGHSREHPGQPAEPRLADRRR